MSVARKWRYWKIALPGKSFALKGVVGKNMARREAGHDTCRGMPQHLFALITEPGWS